ncbi:MAG: small subunit ribosomal protein [Patescibacteria group bacterium]|jgi:small subunit ribosomal protein S2|nr:small subunit ribosomal protein [Patescibacteria group bacterium]
MDNTVVVNKKSDNPLVREMFEAGAHFGYSKSRRHPSVETFIFGYKNKVAILNLEKGAESLSKILDFVSDLGQNGKQILFVGNKAEAKQVVKAGALSINMPYVAERWIGGALTNTSEIKKRLNRLEEIKADEENGALQKYTKKERNLIAKEKEDLERNFGGITGLKKLPDAMLVIDSDAEVIAMNEAIKMHIPVIGLANSDCNISNLNYALVGNDASVRSIEYFISKVVEAYKEGKKNAPKATPETNPVA